MVIEMTAAFFEAFFATLGFSFVFHVPKRHLFWVSLIGGSGWLFYDLCLYHGVSKVIACFVGACIVALMSDIFSRVFKEAATIFLIAGILPLVPGAGMYYTMLYTINGELDLAAQTGIQTLFMAGAIATAIFVINPIVGAFFALKSKKRQISQF